MKSKKCYNGMSNNKCQEILKFIKMNPGCNVKYISITLNIPYSTVKYYVDLCSNEKMIKRCYTSKFIKLYDKDYSSNKIINTIPKEDYIINKLKNNQLYTQKEIIILTKFPQSTVCRLLKDLINNSIISTTINDNKIKYYIK
jgi:predicted transcriptional regulator